MKHEGDQTIVCTSKIFCAMISQMKNYYNAPQHMYRGSLTEKVLSILEKNKKKIKINHNNKKILMYVHGSNKYKLPSCTDNRPGYCYKGCTSVL